jgi:hypothetical protein
MTRTIRDIDADGVVMLTDGSAWRVARDDLPTVAAWLPLDAAELWGAGPSRRLHNVARGETVSVRREGAESQLPSWWARRAAWRGSNRK